MGRRVTIELPEGVTVYRDRHGKARYRFRKTGMKAHAFKSAPGSAEFDAEYQGCFAAPIMAGEGRAVPGSINDLVNRFYQTPKWLAMKPSSKATYRGIIERFRAPRGSHPVSMLKTKHIDKILGDMSGTPAAANNLRKVLKRLFAYAIKIDMRADNPATESDKFAEGDGFHTWTEEEIEQFEARWPLGTKPRLALALMLYTGQRRSDAIRFGRKDTKGGRMAVKQRKTGNLGSIAIHSALRAAIDAMPVIGVDTFLVTEFGKPFTAAGFGNWFREQCDKAGLPQCSAHGLRKAMSRRLAEGGATMLQGRAVTIHKTDKEFAHYAEQAEQEGLADAAMAIIERCHPLANPAKPDLANPS
jgi:integrase